MTIPAGFYPTSPMTGQIGHIAMRNENGAMVAYLVRPNAPDLELGRLSQSLAANVPTMNAFSGLMLLAISEVFGDAVKPI